MTPSTKTRSLDEQRQAEAEAQTGEGAASTNGNGESGESGGPVSHEGGAHAADLEGEGDGEQAGGEDAKEAEVKAPEIKIQGDGQLSLTVGGETPTVATMKLRGGKINIEAGDLDKGKVVDLAVRVRITEVDFVDKTNGATGEVTETERRHVGRIMSVERVK